MHLGAFTCMPNVKAHDVGLSVFLHIGDTVSSFVNSLRQNVEANLQTNWKECSRYLNFLEDHVSYIDLFET